MANHVDDVFTSLDVVYEAHCNSYGKPPKYFYVAPLFYREIRNALPQWQFAKTNDIEPQPLIYRDVRVVVYELLPPGICIRTIP